MPAQTPMPDRLGPYHLLDVIGEGGMGVVHLARDGDGRAVAIELLRPGWPTTRMRGAGWAVSSTRCAGCAVPSWPRSSMRT